jgi:hypothetical protein
MSMDVLSVDMCKMGTELWLSIESCLYLLAGGAMGWLVLSVYFLFFARVAVGGGYPRRRTVDAQKKDVQKPHLQTLEK